MTLPEVRPSPIAGTWYEGNRERLARAVDDYLDAAQVPPLDGEVIALIAPHAGHKYSGPVAGHAFATVRGHSFDIVAVIAPYHNFHDAPLLVSAHAAYETPLGRISIDRETLDLLNEELGAMLGYSTTPISYDEEHSLEIELPFLQRAVIGDFKLLPIMIREQEADVARGLGLALARVLFGKRTLLVASTDLSHFKNQKTATALDAEMLKQFESFQPESIFDAERTGRGSACGYGAVASVLWAARELGANSVKILHQATSGDVTGDLRSVVGYGAAVVLK